MGIESQITKGQIDSFYRKIVEEAEKVIINALKHVGESCVNEARSNGDYIDQTGNLRSSIGYVVVKDGKKIYEDVKQSDRGSEKAKGTNEAKIFINELVRKHNRGIVLIVVAGMNYATMVESKRNVLSSSEMLAEREVPKLLKQLGFLKAA